MSWYAIEFPLCLEQAKWRHEEYPKLYSTDKSILNLPYKDEFPLSTIFRIASITIPKRLSSHWTEY